jgi:ketosteroid isomerase-like protein
MSHENADLRALAEAGYGVLNAGDLDGFLALVAEDVDFTSMVAEAEGTTFRGHDGVRAWCETVRRAFGDVRWELLQVRGSDERAVTTSTRPERSEAFRSRRRCGRPRLSGTAGRAGGRSTEARLKPSKRPGCGLKAVSRENVPDRASF